MLHSRLRLYLLIIEQKSQHLGAILHRDLWSSNHLCIKLMSRMFIFAGNCCDFSILVIEGKMGDICHVCIHRLTPCQNTKRRRYRSVPCLHFCVFIVQQQLLNNGYLYYLTSTISNVWFYDEEDNLYEKIGFCNSCCLQRSYYRFMQCLTTSWPMQGHSHEWKKKNEDSFLWTLNSN